MKNDYYTKLKIILESKNGTLEDYPQSELLTFEYDVTDANIWVYKYIVRNLLTVQGFSEKNIDSLLGEG